MQYASIDTIAAIATPPGSGGIAIIRVSGALSLPILQRTVVLASLRTTYTPRFMHYGHVMAPDGSRVDEVLAVYMPGPHSATGEDVAEIHCHGGAGVASVVLELVLQAGARLAGRGEFTRRALLNGRIDLTQAEAVAEIISAPGAEGVRLAAAKLSGVFAQKIHAIRAGLDAMRVHLIMAVDFAEEEDDFFSQSQTFQKSIGEALCAIRELLHAYERARLWREGVSVALVGCVNAGKSSLFNAFLGRNRALVSSTPGTTRDYLEELISIDGMTVRLFDTAGLREGEDAVEQSGIALSYELAQTADLLLLVMDGQKESYCEEEAFLEQYTEALGTGKVLAVYTKADLGMLGKAGDACPLLASLPVFHISSHTGAGLDALAAGIATTVRKGTSGLADAEGTDLAPNLRQSLLLRKADEALEALQTDLMALLPPDILSVHLDAALYALDEVTGTTSSEVILDTVFSSFCIGK